MCYIHINIQSTGVVDWEFMGWLIDLLPYIPLRRVSEAAKYSHDGAWGLFADIFRVF